MIQEFIFVCLSKAFMPNDIVKKRFLNVFVGQYLHAIFCLLSFFVDLIYFSLMNLIKLNIEKYNLIKNNKMFLERKTKVCEDCFFDLIDLKYYTDDDFNAKVFQGNIKKSLVS